VSELWTAPLVNAYQDLISLFSSTEVGLTLTLFQLSSSPLSSSPPPVQNFLSMIGPPVVTLLPDIPLALHALNLTAALPSPIYLPSLSSHGEENALVVAPTHVSDIPLALPFVTSPQIDQVFWILLAPWSLLTSSSFPPLSSPPSPLPSTNTRFLEGLIAALQRFALFLPLSLPGFDPHSVSMVSDLISPRAPNPDDAGALTPAPPMTQTTSRPRGRLSRVEAAR
jgi:hypothetical protein